MNNSPAQYIAVVVAVLRNSDGRILLAQRPEDARYPLKWEFPGGKVEPPESHLDALTRELEEELGVTPIAPSLLFQRETQYSDGGAFAVSFYLVEHWTGTPQPLASAAVEWVAPHELHRYDVIEGSREVCAMLASA